jgi:hypothetical protein
MPARETIYLRLSNQFPVWLRSNFRTGLRRVFVRENANHARLFFSFCGFDGFNRAFGNRALDDKTVSDIRHLKLGGVFRFARNFGDAVHAAHFLSDIFCHFVIF